MLEVVIDNSGLDDAITQDLMPEELFSRRLEFGFDYRVSRRTRSGDDNRF